MLKVRLLEKISVMSLAPDEAPAKSNAPAPLVRNVWPLKVRKTVSLLDWLVMVRLLAKKNWLAEFVTTFVAPPPELRVQTMKTLEPLPGKPPVQLAVFVKLSLLLPVPVTFQLTGPAEVSRAKIQLAASATATHLQIGTLFVIDQGITPAYREAVAITNRSHLQNMCQALSDNNLDTVGYTPE